MNKGLELKNQPTSPLFTADNVMIPFRRLKLQISQTNREEEDHQCPTIRSGHLLEEAQRLHVCLLDMDHYMANGASRKQKELDSVFRDEFLSLLVGTHLRLLALSHEIGTESRNPDDELAQTHRHLRNSAKLLNRITSGESSCSST